MNKAEEQYQYRFGRCKAQFELMVVAENATQRYFAENITDFLRAREKQNALKKNEDKFIAGLSDYNSEILRLIYGNVITDWPSFVTYMTGETYEKEGVLAMKCTQCGAALNELMVGRCSQPSHEVPIVLCETCCQASPDCVGCKAIDCDGYVKGETHER